MISGKNTDAFDDMSEQQYENGSKYVTRYRRTKNLRKKCAEISTQCDLEILLVVYDRKNNRLRETYTHRDLTLNDLNRMVLSDQKGKNFRYVKEYIGFAEDECNQPKCEMASKTTGNEQEQPESVKSTKSEDDRQIQNDV